MALLLGTEIESLVKRSVCGRVARIGGAVNQLVNYDRCSVTDINIVNGGFCDIWVPKYSGGIISIINMMYKYTIQEIEFIRKGNVIARDRKTIIKDIHYANTDVNLKNRLDNYITSNVIEHSPNQIWLFVELSG